jgi:molybdate transport system substrate-binding protein
VTSRRRVLLGLRADNAAAVIALVIALVLAACSGAAATAPSAATGGLTIYGAASLKAALGRIATAYGAAHPGTTLTISTDSSSALETQVEQGAPADVFLSADTTNPQKLVDKGLAAGPVVPFAANVLTVIVPATNPAGIRTPSDLARPGVKIVAAGDAVPITKYVVQVLDNLAEQADYPADFTAGYAANVASREDNVAAVVSKIELGEGDAAIVYATDAKVSTNVATIAIPDAANVRATYGAVAVKASPNAAAAGAFLTWLVGPDGQAILASLGFLPPS